MTSTNEKRTPFMKKVLISTGVILVLGGAAIILAKLALKGPPIEVGDGSIIFHYDGGIKTTNSANQIEVDKFLHKVKTISIGDYNQPPSSTMDVKGREWKMTSKSTPQFLISLNSYLLGLEEGVAGTCPVAWTGSSSRYTCSPDGTKLTPVTITFTDGNNCPGTASPSCDLSCTSGACLVQLDYK